jgi:hypothetical protein
LSMLTRFALRWLRRAPGPTIWLFTLKSCQLGLSAARDASVLAAILRRASLTALCSFLSVARVANVTVTILRVWRFREIPRPVLSPPCPLRFPPVLVSRVWARSHRSWLRQWLRSSFTAQLPHPAVKRCKSLQLQFYSRAAFPPAVKRRSFTAGLRPTRSRPTSTHRPSARSFADFDPARSAGCRERFISAGSR